MTVLDANHEEIQTIGQARSLLVESDHYNTETIPLATAPIEATTTEDGSKVTMAVEGQSLELSEHAKKELATRLEIPGPYFLKCPSTLQAAQLAHWQTTVSDRKRIQLVISEEDNVIQGVTSPNFVPTPNTRILDALVESVGRGDDENLVLDWFEHSWEFTRIGICHRNASHTVDNAIYNHTVHEDAVARGAEIGDIVRAGVNTINSLVNAHHLEFEPFAFRLACLNRMVSPLISSENERHRYVNPEKSGPVGDFIGAAVEDILRQFDPLFARLDEAAQNSLSEESVLNALNAQASHLPGPYRDEIFAAYELEPMQSTWGIVNAVTRAAERMTDARPHHRLQVERHAGQFAVQGYCDSCHRPFNGN